MKRFLKALFKRGSTKTHIEAAIEHVRAAAEKRGPELDDLMRELCTACTSLRRVESMLKTKNQPGGTA